MVVRRRSVGLDLVILIAGLFMAVLVQGCGSSTELSSSWTGTPVAVGDSTPRWYGALAELKDTHVSLGVENDTGYVYLCLEAPAEQFRRQMMAPGLTVWFESDNGQKMGIHYPMGFAAERNLSGPGEGNYESGQRGQMGQQSLGEMEIIGPGKYDRNVLSTLELRDVKVKIGNVGSQTVYELKVPLHASADHPYAVGVNPGSTLKLEIESGKFEPRKGGGMSGGEGGEGMRGAGRRGGGSGGFGGGYGGGGMRGGGRQGGGANRPESLDETVKVQLANAISSIQH